jgi:hypothetical protein
MKALLLALALVAAPVAAKPPPCWPKQAGSTGSSYKTGETPNTEWIGWVCMSTGKPVIHVVVIRKGTSLVKPDVAGLTPVATLTKFWQANVTLTCASPLIAEGCAAAFKAFDGGQ